MDTNLKELKPKIKALSIYQIAGGCIGLLITMWIMLWYPGSIKGLVLIFFSVAVSLYSYSIYCGIMLLKNYKWGLKHSLINQILQVVNFSIFGYAFQYIAGAYLAVGIDLTGSFNIKLNAGISTWQIVFNDDEQLLYVNLNLVALSLVLFIEKLKTRIDAIEKEYQISNIITTD